MTERSTGRPHVVSLDEAAAILDLPPGTVQSLALAGFLPVQDEAGGPTFALVDLKAFLARNADNGSGNIALDDGEDDAQLLLDALDGRCQDMAEQAYRIFASAMPDAAEWGADQRQRFVDQARSRFEAILAVTAQGAHVDEGLIEELRDVGGTAAWADSPLPQLLMVLRISRDLVVQTAVQVAETRGRRWNVALALVLTRVLPAMDRLTDALAQGYWAAVVSREAEQSGRYQHVVEHSSSGVYEVDLDGVVRYVNEALALVLGRPAEDLLDRPLGEVIAPSDPQLSVGRLLADGGPAGEVIEVQRPDGVRRVLDVRPLARLRDGELIGFQGVVRDITTEYDLERDKNEFLALITYEVRQPLTSMLALGATLETHAGDLGADRVRRIGTSIRSQAERISRLADDLHDVSRLESQSLLLTPRSVRLLDAVEGALAMLGEADGVRVAVDDLVVTADARRLEQVLANLVENGLEYGAAPVTVAAAARPGATIEIVVSDEGPGVPEAMVGQLFGGLRLITHRRSDRGRGTGLGLRLVKGLVEAMGGRVWYEPAPGGGAAFHLALPQPRPSRG